MISKQYFEETFSIATAQALQSWADSNLITQSLGDYGMKISFLGAGIMFSETTLTGLTVGNEYTVQTDTIEAVTNQYRTYINALPNDNSSSIAELGFGTGVRTLVFTATETTMYLAIGDNGAGPAVYSIVDNISVKGDGTDYVTNGTFESGDTTGWTAYNATVEPYQYVVEPPISEDNPYLEQVNIPIYDENNPAHVLISTSPVGAEEPWSDATLNNASYTNFYVKDGNYPGRPTVTISGTSINRRTISTYDNIDSHPGKLDDSSRVKVSLKINGASYWTLNHLSCNLEQYVQWGQEGNFSLHNGASYNIFNEMYYGQGWQVFQIRKNCDNNTIQKCFFDGVNEGMYDFDLAFIQFMQEDLVNMVEMKNNKVVLCEFKNYKPMRLQRRKTDSQSEVDLKNYEGTLFDSNVAWYDEETRCDADGTPNVNGLFTYAEAGWGGVKGASINPDNPVIFSNNAIMGNRQTYYIGAPGDLSGPSPGFTIAYFQAEYIEYRNNVVIDSPAGIALTTNSAEQETNNVIATGNIMYKCGFNNYPDAAHDERCTSARIQNCKDIVYTDNVFREPIEEWAVVQGNYSGGVEVNNNYIIDKDLDIIYDGVGDVVGLEPADTNNYITSAEALTEFPYDYTMHYYKYTNSPTSYTVPNVLRTEEGTEEYNPYLRSINIPVYDSGNTEHCRIPEDEPWSSATLNNANYTVFYVAPGTYTGRPVVTTSGTDTKRRMIVPYNQELHPAKIQDSERAKIAVEFKGASYWTVSKMSSNQESYLEWAKRGIFSFTRNGVIGATDNIIDQIYFGAGWQAVGITKDCHRNTIQKCYMDGCTDNWRDTDGANIQLEGSSDGDGTPFNFSILDTRVILNESRNYRLSRNQCSVAELGEKDYSGGIWDSNVQWFDGDAYCDEDRTPNPNGEYAYTECTLMGAKAAGNPATPNNPITSSNNVLWGGRPTAPGNASLSNDYSLFTVVYFRAQYINYYGNVVEDNPAGIAMTSNTGDVEVWNSKANYNIFKSVGYMPSKFTEDEKSSALTQAATINVEQKLNRIFNQVKCWAWAINSQTGNYLGENTIVNYTDTSGVGGADGVYKESGGALDGYDNPTNTNVLLSTAEGESQYPNDYIIEYAKYTNTPQTKTISNVLEASETTESFKQMIWGL